MSDYYRTDLAAVRNRWVRHVHSRYAITVHPHPRKDDTVVLSHRDHFVLLECIRTDPKLNPVGRGYYDFLGGQLTIQHAPDWTLNPTLTRAARALATHARALAPLARWLRHRTTGRGVQITSRPTH